MIICKEHFSRTCRLLYQHGHSNLLSLLLPIVKTIQLLMGENDSQDGVSKSNDGTAAQVEEILKNANQTSHTGSIAFNFQKMYLHFMFREFNDMKMFAEKFFGVKFHNWVFHFPYTCQKFYGGLVAFWVYRQTKDPTWAERGRSAKYAIKKWAESSQHNFQHKVYLLEAEEASCNNDTESAQSLYEKAISTSREHQ